VSPNPANPIEVPLVHSWWLSKRKGKEAYISPRIENGKVVYEIVFDKFGPVSDSDGTIGRRGGFAVGDRTPISLDYVRKEGRAGRMGSTLMAMVVETARGRTYVTPDTIQIAAADVAKPANLPEGELPRNPRDFKTPNYGLTSWKDLFTARQLNALSVFYESLDEVREIVCNDAMNGGLDLGEPLEENGTGALAYSEVVSVYLALAIGRTADYGNALCGWRSDIETIRNLFSRQAISMVWDYAESNPFSNSTGNFLGQVDWVAKAVANVPSGTQGKVDQFDASSRDYGNFAISTDPPYYDNIGYADLSDFFYVWLRRALLNTMPKLFGTMQTPKAEELVADPYRHGNKQEAEKFFIDGFNRVFNRIAQQSNLDIPITIYYAYKQQDVDSSGNASTGWHTLLDGLISANWEVTATWPVRTESKNRLIGNGRNVLASSIVLSCRVRSKSAETISKQRFVQVLREELPKALHDLMQGSIAPVDLAQAAIGPGIAVFSRYARVREANGSDMSVKDALLLINFTLDEVLNEQESDFDPDTRFAVKWYKQFGWTEGSSGLAEQLARSSDTSVGALERGGILEAKAGKAKLLAPVDLNTNWEPETDDRISIWECVVRLAGVMSREGAEIVAQLLPSIENRVGLDAIKELGFLLFHEAEKKGDTQDAIMFNGLVGAWGDLKEQARKQSDSNESGYQTPFYFEDQED
jgi:putative DNA methylase